MRARLLPLICLVAGCATMSPEECRFANWYDVGLRDGLAGRSLSLYNARVEDCTEAAVRVDGDTYLRGRDDGLQTYCQPANAIAVGLAGASYEGVCPAAIDAEFRRRYAVAYNVYATRAEVARIDSRMGQLEQRLRQIDRDEDRKMRDADKDDDRRRIAREADDQRRRLRNELRDLDFAAWRAREAARAAEWALATLR